MAYYIQYNPATGEIKATVNSEREIICENQIVIPEGWVPTDGMRVNLETKELETIPAPEL